MQRAKNWILGILITALVVSAGIATAAQSRSGSAADRWLHVRVVDDGKDGDKGETVRVNVPLALAEAILPAIKVDRLANGKVRIDHAHKIEEIDLRAIYDAVRNSPDGEFVTVQSTRENVRVAKQGGYLLVNVTENERPARTTKEGEKLSARAEKKVDVKVPISVVEALLSGGTNELDILAAVRALARHGDHELVSVRDGRQTVRVWVDSKSTSE
jgi:hypothetical protein